MESLKKTIGQNLTQLRKSKQLTQLELANKFNYSDKAVSKWEKGDTLPDIEVLYELCEFYGVTLDYLTHTENLEKYVKEDDISIKRNKNATFVLFLTVVWMIATIIFVYTLMRNDSGWWLSFIWSIPASFIVLLIYNRREFHSKSVKYVGFSIFMWTLLTAFFLQFLEHKVWPIFLLGIPIQAIIIIFANMKKSPKN